MLFSKIEFEIVPFIPDLSFTVLIKESADEYEAILFVKVQLSTKNSFDLMKVTYTPALLLFVYLELYTATFGDSIKNMAVFPLGEILLNVQSSIVKYPLSCKITLLFL